MGLGFMFRFAIALVVSALTLGAQQFFPVQDVRAGMRGTGKTIFQGNRIEDFQVEILGVLQNFGPRQALILARLSGGPLAETGILQGMSGSPVYIEGKLLGAVAVGFPFSKEPIAGIQPIEAMLAGASFPPAAAAGARLLPYRFDSLVQTLSPHASSGGYAEIPIPLAVSGFSANALTLFDAGLRRLGFSPQQGVGFSGMNSQTAVPKPGKLEPGSMISVGLITGDLNMTADGTVTYIDGNRVYAFGHRFLDIGSIEMPFARSEVIVCMPNLNSSFKLSSPREWQGTIVSDRATAIAGELGRPSHTIPLTIGVHSSATGDHDYHLQVVNDRLLTPFLTQAALFSTIDATERTIGAGTLKLHGTVEFDGNLPPLVVRDLYISDSGLAQQAAGDAVVTMAFVLGGGFTDLHIKTLHFELDEQEAKHQYRVSQAWASAHSVKPGETVQISAVLQGADGTEVTRSAPYQVPIGAPLGPLNFTFSDAATLNFPDFAGLAQTQFQNAAGMIEAVNRYRGSEALYLRVWRQQPAFSVAGTLPGGELPDPPPSVMLVLADGSSSAYSGATVASTRGSDVAQIVLPVSGYAVTGAKTVQVEVKE
jgi:hypothetical protein